jgi:hypothetical protein
VPERDARHNVDHQSRAFFSYRRRLAGAFDVAVGEFVFAALDNFVAM